MKSAMFAKALTLTAALAIAFTPGCRRKPKEPITPLPSARTGQQGITNPRPGGPGDLSGTDAGRGLTDTSGRPIGSDLGAGGQNGANGIKPGENIGLDGGPHDRSAFSEDRAQFAANVVYYDFDSAVIKTSEKSKISGVAEHLKSNPNLAVEIEGHCDERGTEEYNRSLGERRALAAREELALLGIDPKRVFTISYGEDRPAVDGHSEDAWSRNRRSEFVLLTPR
jgi:peptidoglycan-associated lipoprotein